MLNKDIEDVLLLSNACCKDGIESTAISSNDTDCHLLANAIYHKDYESTEQLYAKYKPFVENYINALGNFDGHAEDLTQEVFLRICRGGSKYDGVGNVEAYLCGISNNVVRSHLKKHKKHFKHKNHAKKELVVEPQDLINEDEEHFIVRFSQTIAALPETYKEVLRLLFVEKMSPSDAAEQMGCSPEAFRQRLCRGLDMLPKNNFKKILDS